MNSKEIPKKKNLNNSYNLKNIVDNIKTNRKINNYSLKVVKNNYIDEMDLEKENNCIIDRNKVDQVSKYIYTKFPKFETHKKIKLYNIKISELILENKKLKKYNNNLEKRILEENTVFEENFKNYEISISNALRLGYSSLFLSNVLNKIIYRDKQFVLRELMRIRDEFKNNLLKSYIHKYSADKLLINSMVIKIDLIYEKNVKSVTLLLVSIIKNKLRHFLKFFLNNILFIKKEKGKLPGGIESDEFFFSLSFLNHVEKVESLLGLVKLIHTLKTRIYIILQYCFSKLVSNNDENFNKKKRTNRNKKKKIDNSSYINGIDDVKNVKIDDMKNVKIDDIKNVKIDDMKNVKIDDMKNVNIDDMKNVKIDDMKNVNIDDMKNDYNDKYTIEENDLVNNIDNYNKNTKKNSIDNYIETYNELSSKENCILLDKKNIINNLDNYDSNMEDDNSSKNSYIPHPNEVYNYLYYGELLKLKKNKSQNYFYNHIDDSECFNSFQFDSETSFSCYDLKEEITIKKFSSTQNVENYLKFVWSKLKNYNNHIKEYSKKIKNDNIDVFFNEPTDFSKSSKEYSINKKCDQYDKSIYLFLLNEKRKILELLEQHGAFQICEKNFIKKNKKEYANLYKRKKLEIDNCKQKQLEFLKITNERMINERMINEKINKKRINKINMKCKKEPSISLNQSYKKNKIQLVTGSDKKNNSEMIEENCGLKNVDNCDLEVESFVKENKKKKISLHMIKSELKDIISQIYDNNNDNIEKKNFFDKKIEDIKNKVSNIKEKSFLCVVGEGPPTSMNLSFNNESQYMNKSKEENVDNLKKSESKILLTLKK
ncbi:conserved Plasmodium protein, unknown function [Plasmodium gallinaceum]|uniref:Uncharacterized protein n=1 Tax=Plasmodium gallinaceum TaxID=5849 RepID=A0A1J1GVC6_PLAGA|nr:conserved Plasmodium protein, unknown function [Plasmodium gallinaceum]CRG96479.1 conserved Plasmodium protein, unknown function [Plasmodium gallinaceum]